MRTNVAVVQQHAATLASLLRCVRVPLPPRGAPTAATDAAALLAQLDDYVLPRLATLGAPLLAVVGGSTGVGKSTLVNAIVGRPVSASGVLRPTTRHPVLVHHPSDAAWFAGGGVLPSLPRLTTADSILGAARGLVLVADEAVPAGLALLDAPDVDSVVEENRALAEQLLAAADLWLFVTSAARYADAVPWELLVAAAQREAATAVVLDRVPPAAVGEVSRDLADIMQGRGLGGSPLFVVEEHLLLDGILPAWAVESVREWLVALAGSAAARDAVVRSTLAGALVEVSGRAHLLAEALDAQDRRVDDLRAVADGCYAAALRRVVAAVDDGSLLRAEVLHRWRDLAGAVDLSRTFDAWVGRVRGRLRPRSATVPPTAAVEAAIAAGVRDVLVDAADRAAGSTSAQWRERGAGALLEPPPSSGQGLPDRATTALGEWRDGVLDLVSTEGAGRRGTARGVAAGTDGVAVVLMVATFATTGGLTGAEVGVAVAAAVASRKVLESVFGARAATRLTDQVRDDLVGRLHVLLEREATLFTTRLDDLGVQAGLGAAIRESASALHAERHRVAG